MSTSTATPGLADALRRLAVARDADAWSVVIERSGADIARIAQAILGETGLADDAAQETLLQLRDDAAQFRPRNDPDADARAWIRRVAATTALQILRARRRASARDALAREGSTGETSPASGPVEDVIRDERVSLVRQAVADLPEPARSAVVLHHLLGVPIAEVATQLGLPLGTAKSGIHRGLERLRKRLNRLGIESTAAAIAVVSGLPGPRDPSIPVTTWRGLLSSPRRASIHLITPGAPLILMSSIALVLASTIACAVYVAAADGSTPAPSAAGGVDVAPAARPHRATLQFIAAPATEIWIGLQCEYGLSLRGSWSSVPPPTTLALHEATSEEALRVLGKAWKVKFMTHADGELWSVPDTDADSVAAGAAQPLIPGADAAIAFTRTPITMSWGSGRLNLLHVLLRGLHANVIIDPALEDGDNHKVEMEVAAGTFDDVLAALDARAEVRDGIGWIVPRTVAVGPRTEVGPPGDF